MKILKSIFPKKKILGTIILLAVIFLFVHPTQARYDPGGAEGGDALEEYKQALEEPGYNLPQFVLYTSKYLCLGLNRLLIGLPPLEEEKTSSGGLLGVLSSLINEIYQNKPLSSSQYFAYLGERLNLVKPAYAQGQGWAHLSPILKLWKGLRDITYLFFVIIFVAFGFMIMLRKKIDPQTSISIQSAIPKITISLILITFSFAICGLIVDIAFLASELLKAIFVPIMRPEFNYLPATDIFSAVKDITTTLVKTTTPSVSLFGIDIGPIIGFFQALWGVLSADFAGIFTFVIAIILVTSVFKIFIGLVSRYAMIFIYTLFSPFIFLFSSFPGQNDHIANFFRSFISNVIVFPATVVLLNIADYFLKIGPFLTPPLQPIPPLGTPTGSIAPLLPGFLGLGIIMATSRLPEIIDDALKTKPTIAPTLGAETTGILKRIPVVGSFIQ